MPEVVPRCTVIMPVRNEADFIERSLGSVLAQDYPSDLLQVLVVDGESDDGTRSAVERLARSRPGVVRLMSNPARTAPEALNLGLREASGDAGDVIVRVDGHCVIPADYLRRCVRVLGETGVACVGGRMDTVGQTSLASAIATAQGSRFGVGGVAFRTGAARAGPVDTVAFGAYRRGVFEEVGGFDPELVRNQDDDLNYRLNRAGHTVWLDPSIVSVYFSRASLSSLWRQYYWYGSYKVRVIQKNGLSSLRHLAPAGLVLALGAGGLASLATRSPVWFAAAAAPYVAASLAAAVWAGRRRLRLMPLLPFAFATMHLAYGIGFLTGLWRWRRGFHRSPTVHAHVR